ncbi:MAG: hypothetical protein E6K81_02010 [Candidatus Eisenbacteria bacterium]|uniref:Uncharacterized protein n=1 Tax=Eiseniibacteriota bacterium TaxID=2212470 RepID=A0A538UDG6_UNCEI|nr:MAG: hypothetical protein E6K81_02010 [Candidatus Eisenbacteria bacterium]
MTRGLVLFEDERWPDLAPLTDLLPVPALAFGASDLASRWRATVTEPLLAIEARAGAMGVWRERAAHARAPHAGADEVLAVNAAVLPGPWLAAVSRVTAAALFVAGDRVAGARLADAAVTRGLGTGERFAGFLAGLGLPRHPVEARFIARPWQMVEWNAEAISADLARARGEVRGEVHALTAVVQPERVTVAQGARVDAYAVLDAREGPMWGPARICWAAWSGAPRSDPGVASPARWTNACGRAGRTSATTGSWATV